MHILVFLGWVISLFMVISGSSDLRRKAEAAEVIVGSRPRGITTDPSEEFGNQASDRAIAEAYTNASRGMTAKQAYFVMALGIIGLAFFRFRGAVRSREESNSKTSRQGVDDRHTAAPKLIVLVNVQTLTMNRSGAPSSV